MRQPLLSEGAKELSYEIREIVKKAELLRRLGKQIYWENIGDPIQKHHTLPIWIREIIADLAMQMKYTVTAHRKACLKPENFWLHKPMLVVVYK